jgi:hypothetical protein
VGVFITNPGSGYTSPTITFPTPGGGSAATVSIVANQRVSIIGNTSEEDKLLSFCRTKGINGLVLQDLQGMNWSDPGLGSSGARGIGALSNLYIT